VVITRLLQDFLFAGLELPGRIESNCRVARPLPDMSQTPAGHAAKVLNPFVAALFFGEKHA